ncbi:MAG TPA: methyltransferase [Stellaceae bacterium]|jgi:tRNA1(Val) A37 N6-methylase TrmN6|nr:methyltransferase [Stellaceae bacterium]
MNGDIPANIADRIVTSDDTLLGGRVKLRQPVDGYRVAIDPVLLAAAVPARAQDRVLDLGCGTGAASLCLAARAPECQIVGLERDREIARLAAENIARNEFAARLSVIEGDLLAPPAALVARGLTPGSFTQVMANPPFLEAARASASPIAARAVAAVESEALLADWIDVALTMLRDKGTLTVIQRADRLGDLLAALDGRAGGVVVFPLWPGEGKASKRILLQAKKGSAAPLILAQGLVLHRADGRNSEAAEAVLRHGAALSLVS